MRKFVIALGVVAAAAATPAMANEGRFEGRGGIVWANGVSEAVVGAATGYDWDMGETTFIGVEASADKILVDGSDIVFGATVRGGVKAGEAGKFFVAGGYSFGDGDAWHLGAGYQHKVSGNMYLKAEYRHFFDVVDINAATVGVGFNF